MTRRSPRRLLISGTWSRSSCAVALVPTARPPISGRTCRRRRRRLYTAYTALAPLDTLQGARTAGAVSTVGGRGWRRGGSYVPLPVLMPMPARARRTATHLSVVMVGPELVVDLGCRRSWPQPCHDLLAPVPSRIRRDKYDNTIILFGTPVSTMICYESFSSYYPLSISSELPYPSEASDLNHTSKAEKSLSRLSALWPHG